MRYVRIALTTLFVLAAVGVPLYLASDRPSAGAPPEAPPRVEAEQYYYVLLTVVEVDAERSKGRRWDRIGDSAPDVYYEIHWRGHEVFESSTKSDTLVARWTNVAVGLGDVVGTVSLDDSIKAARIAVRAGDTIEFRVYDEDVVDHDLVGRFEVPVERLEVGDRKWERPGGRLASVTCRVVPIGDVAFETLTK